jgi:heme exporter protein CcmD
MFGEHAPFIIPAYAISALALAVTTLIIWRTHHARRKELQRVEVKRDQRKA